MPDPGVKLYLKHFVKKRDQIRLINSLIFFILLNLGVYLILLTCLLIFNLSLLFFHLVFYISLSLFPLFFLFKLEGEILLKTIRRIDKNCLVEAYLETSSKEHRSFMVGRVKTLLEKRGAEKPYRFRISQINRYLVIAVFFLFLFLQSTSYMTLYSLTPELSARGLKSRLVERAVSRKTDRETSFEDLQIPDEIRKSLDPDYAEPQTSPGSMGENIEGGELSEALPQEGRGPGQKPSGLGSDTEEGESPDNRRMLFQVPAGEKGLESLMESAIRRDAGTGEQPGIGSASSGSEEAGKTFVESPLKDYRSIPERITAEGGREVSPGSALADNRRELFLNALFGDFFSSIDVDLDFDPLMDRIRERYLELVNEKY